MWIKIKPCYFSSGVEEGESERTEYFLVNTDHVIAIEKILLNKEDEPLEKPIYACHIVGKDFILYTYDDLSKCIKLGKTY